MDVTIDWNAKCFVKIAVFYWVLDLEGKEQTHIRVLYLVGFFLFRFDFDLYDLNRSFLN